MLRYRYTLDLFPKNPKTFQITGGKPSRILVLQISSDPNRWCGLEQGTRWIPENRHYTDYTILFLKIKIHFPGNWIVVPGTHRLIAINFEWAGRKERWLPIAGNFGAEIIVFGGYIAIFDGLSNHNFLIVNIFDSQLPFLAGENPRYGWENSTFWWWYLFFDGSIPSFSGTIHVLGPIFPSITRCLKPRFNLMFKTVTPDHALKHRTGVESTKMNRGINSAGVDDKINQES